MPISITSDIPVWVAPNDSPGMRDDLFPAVIHDAGTGELILDPARVVLSDDRLWIFADAPQGVVCVLSQQTFEVAGDRWDGFAITLVNPESSEPGHTLLVTRSTGCGCGSRLKSFRPFKHSHTAALPH